MKTFIKPIIEQITLVYAIIGLVSIVTYNLTMFYIGFIILVPYFIYKQICFYKDIIGGSRR